MIVKTNDPHYYRFLKELRCSKDRIIFINGCFDLIHLGHIKMFNYAKKTLFNSKAHVVCGVNSDYSIMLQKKSHPIINNEDYRATVVQEFVDDVIIFNEEVPKNLLYNVMPDYIIKGEEYKDKQFPEREIAEIIGAEFKFFSNVDGVSTTQLFNRIGELYEQSKG